MFRYKATIKLHETDAAGRLFFTQQFKLFHDAYEELLSGLGLGFSVIFKKKNYFLPIVHASADYEKPLFVGDCLIIEVATKHVGETSFSLAYRLLKNKNTLVGRGETVHVAVSKKTSKKVSLPKEIHAALKKI
jgi:1,4-dihydroxy-2-naphthoyl-CoA hydrolase